MRKHKMWLARGLEQEQYKVEVTISLTQQQIILEGERVNYSFVLLIDGSIWFSLEI